MTPREPSAEYYRKGIAALEHAEVRSSSVSRRWRFATAAIAMLLCVSVVVNVVLWRQLGEGGGRGAENVNEVHMVSSSLILDGDFFRGETRYEPIGERNDYEQ